MKKIISFLKKYEFYAVVILFALICIPISMSIYKFSASDLGITTFTMRYVLANILFMVAILSIIVIISFVGNTLVSYSDNLKRPLFISLFLIGTTFYISSLPNIITWSAPELDTYQLAIAIEQVDGYLSKFYLDGFSLSVWVKRLLGIFFIILSILCVTSIIRNMSKLLFINYQCTNTEKLKVIIASYVLIVFCYWALYSTIIFWIPTAFDYIVPTDSLVFLFDMLYFSVVTWASGSVHLVPVSIIGKSVILITSLGNILFFIVFLAGFFADSANNKSEQLEQRNTVQVKKQPKKRTRK